MNQSNDAIFVIDTNTSRFLNVNNKACYNLGYSKNELLTMGVIDIEAIVPDDFSWKEHMKEVRNEGHMLLEGTHKRKDGTTYPAEVNAKLVYINNKEYMVSVVRDITERKNAEEELKKYHNELELRVHERTLEIEGVNENLLREINDRREAEEYLIESEERFRIAASTISDLIWESDIRTNRLDWYDDIDRRLGYEEGEFPRTITGHMESIHEDDRERLIKSMDQAFETGNDLRVEYRIRCKDGTYRNWDETGKAIEYEDGKAVKWIGSVTDITERKKVEEQILKSEEQFKKLSQEFNALLNAIPDNIILLDSDLKILWANRASTEKFKKESSLMEGQHCYKLCCNVSSPCENCPAKISFNSGREETARIFTSSGIVWNIRAFPIKDEEGNVKKVIEVARDVSVRVNLEKEADAMQAKLIHTNKMTSLGTLVSGVAHEINNPNSFIMTNADLFRDIWKDAYKMLKEQDGNNENTQIGGISFSELETVVPKLLSGIYEGSGRIRSIVDDLRDFARSDRGNLDEKVDVNKAVRAASNILDSYIKKYTDNYHLSCRDNIPFINGNSQQIEQVIINLIMNSLQALPNSESCIIVSTYYDNADDQVIIKVQDEGTGISESIIERITEPFFTTRMESGGTGLGLSISYAIIKEHKGSLEFISEKNKRTVAFVKLPACSDARND